MSDTLRRFQLENLHVRGEWVSLHESWQSIQNTTSYPPAIQQVLGEAVVAISLLADSLKFDGSLILQIHGTAPVNMLVVQATSDGALRGLANWQGEISPNASFQELFQPSGTQAPTMAITVEPNPQAKEQHSERYQSLVPLTGDSLADCLTQYFAQSEQLNTRMWLAVNETHATGMMLQSLPTDETEAQQEGWNHACILADTIKDEELLNLDAQTLLQRLYHEEDLRLYEAKNLRFECSCSQEKIEHAIRSIGETEANAIIAEQGNITVDCDFCNTKYVLDNVDVTRLFSQADINPTHSGKDNGLGSVH